MSNLLLHFGRFLGALLIKTCFLGNIFVSIPEKVGKNMIDFLFDFLQFAYFSFPSFSSSSSSDVSIPSFVLE